MSSLRSRNHRRALKTIAVAGALDLVGGVCFAWVEHLSVGLGLYWAVATATTVGYGDVAPHTTAGHVITVLVMLTVVPLFAATFSLLTSGLTATHVHSEGERAVERLDHIIHHVPDIPELPPKATN
jgi:voltage-gated potassium channel